MKRTKKVMLAFLGFAPLAFAAPPQTNNVATLYCTGKTWNAALGDSEIPVDGIVRLSAAETYLEIHTVGYGSTNKSLKQLSSMSVSGTLTLQPALANEQAREVSFNLNRFSGELFLYTPTTGTKSLFLGICKPAVPLF